MSDELPTKVTRDLAEPLSERDRAVVLLLYAMGYQQRRIAAFFDVNQGRISEAVTAFRGGKHHEG